MEKRRRERINRSLEELKRLVLEAQNRDVSTICCVSTNVPTHNGGDCVQSVKCFFFL